MNLDDLWREARLAQSEADTLRAASQKSLLAASEASSKAHAAQMHFEGALYDLMKQSPELTFSELSRTQLPEQQTD